MANLWVKKTKEEINSIVFNALSKNVNYEKQNILGIPASGLDSKVFNQDVSFLEDAPYLTTLLKNPNHIGCHTLSSSESFFTGTQELEREVIEICATDILKGEPHSFDGYVASGGTEANIQAMWTYRNYYKAEFNASLNEICLLASEDSHYSVNKGSDILSIDFYKIPVNENNRTINKNNLKEVITQAQKDGKKYFIVLANMMTTMFGSVDDVELYTKTLSELNCHYKLHIDAAFGGFYYPFSNKQNPINFSNPNISSFTLDAHKMAQAPYGTGIFIIRKNFMKYTNTSQAKYVKGEDFTLVGSRSGANAIAIWMILMQHGPFGWMEKIFILQKRTQWLIEQLTGLNIEFYNYPNSNIITIKSNFITQETAIEFGLVPDNHHKTKWYKIVVMEHVTIEKLVMLLDKIKNQSPILK